MTRLGAGLAGGFAGLFASLPFILIVLIMYTGYPWGWQLAGALAVAFAFVLGGCILGLCISAHGDLERQMALAWGPVPEGSTR